MMYFSVANLKVVKALTIQSVYKLSNGMNSPGFEAEAKDVSSSKHPDRLWAHPASYPVAIGILSREQSSREVTLITQLQLLLRLRMGGATPLRPNNGLMDWTTLAFSFKTVEMCYH